MAEEVRNAIDAYLAGVSAEELALLDMATQEAAKHIRAMTERLEATNRRLDAVFAELERLRVVRSTDFKRAAT